VKKRHRHRQRANKTRLCVHVFSFLRVLTKIEFSAASQHQTAYFFCCGTTILFRPFIQELYCRITLDGCLISLVQLEENAKQNGVGDVLSPIRCQPQLLLH
jgi:hypothetical protein